MSLKKQLLCGMIALCFLVGASSGWAAGGDSSDSAEPTITDHEDYQAAQQAIEAKDFQEAIALLKKLDEEFSEEADVLNLLGYGYRNIGDFPTSQTYYLQALQIDPTHRGANEYLGELYLQTGELKKAEERLAVLDDECFFGCEEYDELKEAIEAYKKNNL